MNRSEWQWAWTWAAAVAALSLLPFAYASLAAPPGYTFGGFLINALDGNSYLAKMRQGYDGAWLFRLPFTPEDQQGILVFTFYLALGHMARVAGLPLILVFHLARAASGIFLLLTVYRLAAELTDDVAARRWAFAAAAFGSGLAVLSLLIGRNDPEAFVPVDLFLPEAFGFYSILANPHFSLAFALEAWALILVLRPPAPNAPEWQQLAAAALAGLGAATQAPYLAPVAGLAAAVGIFFARPLNRPLYVRAAALFAAMGTYLVYVLIAMRSDPAAAAWAGQNVTVSPPPADLLLGLGIWPPLALLGAWRAAGSIRRGESRCRPLLAALLAWLALTAALVYFPYPLQRRFIGGVFVPLAALSGIGLARLLSQAGQARWIVTAAAIVFGFITNVLLLAALFRAPATADPMIYLSDGEAAALRWLSDHATPGDVILADARLGNFVPGWTGARTVYGHPMETIDAAIKRAEVEAYYAGGSAGLLERYPVRYVMGGPARRGWRPVFTSGGTPVYAP